MDILLHSIGTTLLVLYLHGGIEGKLLERKEAIALLVELGSYQLVSPDFVILEQRKLDRYQLKIKGNYNFKEIGLFVKNRFSLKEVNNYLVIYKP